MPETDAWEQLDHEKRTRLPKPILLWINYTDRLGQTTQRDVYATYYNQFGFQAFCLVRKSNRTFMFKGINQVIVMSTGEIIDDVFAYFDNEYKTGPTFAAKQFSKEHYSALYMMFYAAITDGKTTRKEYKEISGFALFQGMNDPEQLKALIEIVGDFDTPQSFIATRNRFYEQARHVATYRSPEYQQALMGALVAIIRTDKSPHPDELRLLAYAAKQWKLAVPDDLKPKN